MQKKNNLTDDVKAFFRVGNDIDHLLVFVPWLHKMSESTVRKSNEILEKKGAPPNSFGPATGSSMIDVFADSEFTHRVPLDKRITRGADVARMATEVEQRFFALMMTILQESWETFLRSLYAKMLFHLREDNSVRLPQRERFHDVHKGWRKYRNTPPYFTDYVAFACRNNCSEAIRVFQAQLDWSKVHDGVWDGIDWRGFSRLLSFCRNQIVHSDGRVSEAALKKLHKKEATFVRQMMDTTILGDYECIRPDKEMVHKFVSLMNGYVYAIYVLMSNRCGLRVDFDPRRKEETRQQIRR